MSLSCLFYPPKPRGPHLGSRLMKQKFQASEFRNVGNEASLNLESFKVLEVFVSGRKTGVINAVDGWAVAIATERDLANNPEKSWDNLLLR